MTRPRRSRARSRASQRRGMATLLVLVSIGAAMVLTVSFASSRQGSAAIGQNAASTGAAASAARAGAQIAQAILETDKGWQSDGDPDVLYKEFSLNNAKVSIYATTVQGGAPGVSEQDVLITARANVNGIDAVVQRVVRYQPTRSAGQAIDAFMEEFAIYASNKLTMESTCTVARWMLSPASRAGKAVKVGLGFTNASDLSIHPSTVIPGMALYTVPGASSGLTSVAATARYAPGDALPIAPRVLPAAIPSAINSLATVGGHQYIDGVSTTRSQGRWGDVVVTNRGVLTLGTSGNTTLYNVDDLIITNEGVVVIRGDVRIVVRDDFRVLSRGAVELAPGAKLIVYFIDSLELEDSAVGFDRAIARDTSRSASSVMGYESPAQITIAAISPSHGGTADKNHSINQRALVRANIHTPYDKPTIDNSSVIFGRITGRDVTFKRSAALFYDPAMDRNMGYTTRSSPLYNVDGGPATNLALALSIVSDAQGCEVLPIVVGGMCPSKPATVVSTGATARSGSRARGAEWPFVAFALEKHALSDRKTGLFIPPASDARLTTYAAKTSALNLDVTP